MTDKFDVRKNYYPPFVQKGDTFALNDTSNMPNVFYALKIKFVQTFLQFFNL